MSGGSVSGFCSSVCWFGSGRLFFFDPMPVAGALTAAKPRRGTQAKIEDK